jgi:hypothetical protein
VRSRHRVAGAVASLTRSATVEHHAAMARGVRSILPVRPLELRAGYARKHELVALLVLLLGVGAIAGVPYLAHDITDVARDQEVWDHGVRATDESISGREHSRYGLSWLIASYDFRVSYVDDRGEKHDGVVDFATALGELDTGEETEVRYDPAHPERFAVSWAIAARGPRYRGAIALVSMSGVLGVFLIWGAWNVRRKLQRERQIAAEGLELEVRVISRQFVARRGKITGEVHYVLEIPPADGVAAPRTQNHKGSLLLECGSEGRHVLALVLPGDHKHVLLVREDLAPLVVTDAERDVAVARAASAA